MSLVLATVVALSCPQAPLPEGNALVRGLVGAQRRNEEALSLYVYDVLETRVMPDLVGLPAIRVERWAESSGFRLAPRRRVAAPGAEEGTVVGQLPRAGHPVSSRGVIEISVATGER